MVGFGDFVDGLGWYVGCVCVEVEVEDVGDDVVDVVGDGGVYVDCVVE